MHNLLLHLGCNNFWFYHLPITYEQINIQLGIIGLDRSYSVGQSVPAVLTNNGLLFSLLGTTKEMIPSAKASSMWSSKYFARTLSVSATWASRVRWRYVVAALRGKKNAVNNYNKIK